MILKHILLLALLAPAILAGVAPAIANSGIASFYGHELAGRRTASGERFNPNGLTAAHRSLPLGTRLVVTNIANGRSVVVRVNDRGPFVRSRVLDVSLGAARALGFVASGTARIRFVSASGTILRDMHHHPTSSRDKPASLRQVPKSALPVLQRTPA